MKEVDEDKKYPAKKHDLMDFGNDLMRAMDEFFYSKPSRNLLDSIDTFFQQQVPFGSVPVDMYETEREWVVKVDVPGGNKEDINIDLLGDRIKISISNDEELKQHDEKSDYYRRERRMFQTERVVRLPYEVDRKKTKATVRNGVLELRGPKEIRPNYRLDIE